jgi:chromosome segregation ATPase
MHEPWPLHENFRPDVFDKEFTDRDPLPTEPSEEILRKTIEDAESPIGGVDTVDEEVGGDRTTIDEEIPEGPPPPALPPTPDEQRAKLDAEIAALEEDLSIALRDEFVVLRSKQNLARLQRGNTDPFKDTKTYLALSEEIANLGLQIDDTLARVEQLKERLADLNARKAAIK